MNPNLSRIALRPRGATDVFDLVFRVLREAWQPALRLTAVMLLPVWLACAVASWATEGHWAVAFVPIALAPYLQAPYTVLTGRVMFSDEVSVADVLKHTVRRLGPLTASAVIALLGDALCALTCFLALPLVQAVLLFLPEATVLENVDVQRAITRSRRLAGARLGIAIAGVFARIALTGWAALVGEETWQGVVSTVLQLGTPFGSMWTGHVTPGLVGGLLLVQPLFAMYRMLLYVDVRTRSEGWDLQVALRAANLAGAR